MAQNRGPRSQAKAKAAETNKLGYWVLGAGVLAAGALWASSLLAESHVPIVESHGYSSYGELKYGPDFTHLDYVNPDAPKGGEISIWAQGTFDTMNPYVTKGTAGSLASIGYERLMTGVADEVGSSYCLLCSTIEYPEDESWVIFNLRPEAAFSDGSPLTAHDVV